MDRLTREDWKKPQSIMWKKVDELDIQEDVKKSMEDILRKLAEYEDLEEQNRLLKLPVVVGDTVYCIRQSWSGYLIDKKMFKIGMMDKFGKTVFLSREEAEAALKEMGE